MPIRYRRSSPRLTYSRPGAQWFRGEGEKIVTKIIKRTHSGKDENGQPFAPYTGKRAGERVDLTETGAMTMNLQVTSASDKRIAIGFTKTREGEKAVYHDLGTKARRGRSSSGRFLARGRSRSGRFQTTKGLPARPWLGVAQKWVDELIARMMKLVKVK